MCTWKTLPSFAHPDGTDICSGPWTISVFDILKKTRHVPKFVQINRTNANSFQAFHNELKLQFDTLKMNNDLFCDPNKNYQYSVFWMQKPNILRLKTVKLKNHKHKLSQWMTNGILNSVKYRDKIFLRLKAMSNGTELHKRLTFKII